MARTSREAIETFPSITGESESVAVRKPEEYGGNLDGAINAHFVEDDRQFTAVSPLYDFVDTRIQREDDSRGILPLFSAARTFKPFHYYLIPIIGEILSIKYALLFPVVMIHHICTQESSTMVMNSFFIQVRGLPLRIQLEINYLMVINFMEIS